MHTHDGPGHEHHHTKKFDPSRSASLDDAARLAYVDPDRLLELLDVPPDGTLVDFGAGTGVYAIEIAERRPDVRVIALDEQPTMLERLREKPRAARANLVTSGPEDLLALAGRVDRVLALNVLHELDGADFLALRSLLAPDGHALIVDWNPGVERPRGPAPEHLFDTEAACALLARFGFVAEPAGAFPYHLAFVCRPHAETTVG